MLHNPPNRSGSHSQNDRDRKGAEEGIISTVILSPFRPRNLDSVIGA
jgi:hypothetical protein